ncbi:MAG: urease accessory UreF family protein [Pseudomonadota bacterium]
MPTDAQTDLLALVQWMSPAFPLGSFAYSHGFEAAVNMGQVTDAESLEAWCRAILIHGSGHNDAVLLAATRNGAELGAMESLAEALASCPERLEETRAQGRAFIETTNAILGTDSAPLALPVAVGLQSRRLQSLSTETVLALYLQSFVGNLVQCTIRYVPLGQSAGHAVLNRLAPVIARCARELAEATADDLASAAFGADLAAMAHEHQEVRVFRT